MTSNPDMQGPGLRYLGLGTVVPEATTSNPDIQGCRYLRLGTWGHNQQYTASTVWEYWLPGATNNAGITYNLALRILAESQARRAHTHTELRLDTVNKYIFCFWGRICPTRPKGNI